MSRKPAETCCETAYNSWAETYDTDHNKTRDLDAAVLRAQTIPLAGRTVLELGCGTGKNTAWLASKAARVVGLDFSASMLAKAKRRMPEPHVAFLRGDIRQPWPVMGQAIDVLVSNLVLEHIERLEPLFAEAARVLRPGGLYFLSELHPYRQLRGVTATYTDAASNKAVAIPGFMHSIADFVNGALPAGFVVRRLGEWREAGAARDAVPRLFTALLQHIGEPTPASPADS